jgi:hypothetical protein
MFDLVHKNEKSPVLKEIEFWCFFDSVRERDNSIPIPSEVAKCAISNSSQSSPKRQYILASRFFFFSLL